MHLFIRTQERAVQQHVIIANVATGDNIVSMHRRRWAVNLQERNQRLVASK